MFVLLGNACFAPGVVAQQPVKILPVNAELYERYAGNYKRAKDRVVSVGGFYANGGRLTFYDSKTRRNGVLYDVSETDFVSGTPSGTDSVQPTDLRVTFKRNARGAATGLTWREGSEPAATATRVDPHRSEDVTFNNGDVTLRGTLISPSTPGPHPVIVILHGGDAGRRPFNFWPYFLVRYGIASLVYDKRGAGASTGNWQSATFEDLAGDALAAVELLRHHPKINPRQIGLWGNSNSGWVVPIAAARSKDVAFVISRAGSTLPDHENILYEIENDARARGFSDQEIKQAVALRRKYHETLIANAGWENLKSEVETAKNERWFAAARMTWFLTFQIPPDRTTLTALRNPLLNDPMPYWERVTCPVLALNGQMDENVPTARTVPMLAAALKRAGNKDYTITVIPNANHGLAEVSPSTGSEPPGARRYASGYMDGIVDWLVTRLNVNRKQSKLRSVSKYQFASSP